MNGDVDAAVQTGEIRSGRDRSNRAGFFEDRLPRNIIVDEAWYLTTCPDMRQAFRGGGSISAQHHFTVDGFKVGRLPYLGRALNRVEQFIRRSAA